MVQRWPAELDIISERIVENVEVDFEVSNETKKLLLKHAKENILKDENALLRWAFTSIIKENLERDLTRLKRKNGKRKTRRRQTK